MMERMQRERARKATGRVAVGGTAALLLATLASGPQPATEAALHDALPAQHELGLWEAGIPEVGEEEVLQTPPICPPICLPLQATRPK